MKGVDQYLRSRDLADMQSLVEAIPYARFMGFCIEPDGDDVVVRLPFREGIVGNANLRALHGGALGSLMEFAAICQLIAGSEIRSIPKTINLTVDYLRGTKPEDAWARASVVRQGRRIASVHAYVYQDDPEHPVCASNSHFLLKVDDPK